MEAHCIYSLSLVSFPQHQSHEVCPWFLWQLFLLTAMFHYRHLRQFTDSFSLWWVNSSYFLLGAKEIVLLWTFICRTLGKNIHTFLSDIYLRNGTEYTHMFSPTCWFHSDCPITLRSHQECVGALLFPHPRQHVLLLTSFLLTDLLGWVPFVPFP